MKIPLPAPRFLSLRDGTQQRLIDPNPTCRISPSAKSRKLEVDMASATRAAPRLSRDYAPVSAIHCDHAIPLAWILRGGVGDQYPISIAANGLRY